MSLTKLILTVGHRYYRIRYDVLEYRHYNTRERQYKAALKLNNYCTLLEVYGRETVRVEFAEYENTHSVSRGVVRRCERAR